MPSFSARYGRLVIPVVLIILILHLRSTEFRPSPSPVGVEYVDQHTDPNPEPEVKVEEEHVESIPATDNKPSTILNETNNEDEPPIICPPLPGIEDVLVVVKTGITEAQDKIPVHLRTTLRCIPHRIIVSDYEEDISGVRTYDVLENVNETLKQSNDDFRIYNRAREYGRAGLLTQDLATEANGPTGMPNNPGWKLDKWKFLPMVCEAARARPDARWYVFLEADTYAIWRNLLAWLDRLDSNTRLYLGNQMQIGPDLIFAHGGSGFVLSQAAVQALLPYYSETRAQWDDFTETQWAGDSVLGKVLAEAGVPLTWSWPLLSTRSVWEVDSIREAFGKRPWCVPAVTFHHMTPADVERMHEFEQEWFAHTNHSTLLHSNIFHNLIRPSLSESADDWDNFPIERNKDNTDPDAPTTPATLTDCAAYCARLPDCMQYRLDAEGRCSTSPVPLRGIPSSGVRSGWMLDRVDSLVGKMGGCEEVEW